MNGYIEVVYPFQSLFIPEGVIGIVNDNFIGLEFNKYASAIFGIHLFGDVVICMDEMLK